MHNCALLSCRCLTPTLPSLPPHPTPAPPLPQLDAGVPEELLLLGRDGQSMMVVTYADVKVREGEGGQGTFPSPTTWGKGGNLVRTTGGEGTPSRRGAADRADMSAGGRGGWWLVRIGPRRLLHGSVCGTSPAKCVGGQHSSEQLTRTCSRFQPTIYFQPAPPCPS